MSHPRLALPMLLLVCALGSARLPLAAAALPPPRPLLSELSKHLGGHREREIVEQLVAHGMTALPVLVELLRHPNDRLRRVAGRILRRLGPAAEPALAELLAAIRDWRLDTVLGSEILQQLHLPRVWQALWDAAPGTPNTPFLHNGDFDVPTITAMSYNGGGNSPSYNWPAGTWYTRGIYVTGSGAFVGTLGPAHSQTFSGSLYPLFKITVSASAQTSYSLRIYRKLGSDFNMASLPALHADYSCNAGGTLAAYCTVGTPDTPFVRNGDFN